VLADSIPSPSSLAVRRERAVLLADALEKLPADYRQVFVLRNIEHIPFNEIAVRMGRSPGAARVLWTRAMRRLSELVGDHE
jgi:RNA polymerase sigma-70 factor (ECF subfamily)